MALPSITGIAALGPIFPMPRTALPSVTGVLINMFLLSRHIKRIPDHAVNIAEEVIYVTDGEIVRHGKL